MGACHDENTKGLATPAAEPPATTNEGMV